MITFLSTRSPAGAAGEQTRAPVSTAISVGNLDSLIRASSLLTSGCQEQEVPQRVDKRVHDRRSEDRPGLAPRPAVEQSSDGSKQDVAPVRESPVGDVRKPEQHRCGPPSDE